jgi:hypothetical protein
MDLFVYERDSGSRPGAGRGRADWPGSIRRPGVGVREVRTAYGSLSYSFKKEGPVRVLTIEPGVAPPGGFVVQWPEGVDLPPRPRIDGRRGEWKGREVVIPAGARRVEFR